MSAARKKSTDDFENRYLDLFEDTVKSMDKKIDRIEEDTKSNTSNISRLNTKLNRVENEVFPNQAKTVKELPSWWRDPAIIKLLTLVAGAVILAISLFAALRGVNLPGLF